jgi:hypothetical protein
MTTLETEAVKRSHSFSIDPADLLDAVPLILFRLDRAWGGRCRSCRQATCCEALVDFHPQRGEINRLAEDINGASFLGPPKGRRRPYDPASAYLPAKLLAKQSLHVSSSSTTRTTLFTALLRGLCVAG